jgi:hypothetical protein
MRLPEIWAKCELCEPECAGHPPEEVAWSPKREQWLCSYCFYDDFEYDAEEDEYEYVNEAPMAYAKDAMLGAEEQMQRLIAAATRKRMGVK